MPLILAIEPDRRQASQLNAVVKGRLHADLVIAESAELALAALGDRVPDLILTSALLSPNDEVVLGERLRALDGMAAHVQTLTIPVLAAPRPRVRAKVGGMLSALRRGKSQAAAAPDGCDPVVFAAQCAEYLERAVTEHAVKAAATEHAAERVLVAAPTVEAPASIVEEAALAVEFDAPIEEVAAPIVELDAPAVEVAAAVELDTPAVEMAAAAVEPDPPVIEASEPEPIVLAVPVAPAVRKTHSAPLVVNERFAAATVQEAIAQIEAMVARESLAASEAVDYAEPAAEPDVPDGFIDLDLSSFLDDDAGDRGRAGNPGNNDEPDVYDINVTSENPPAEAPAPRAATVTTAKPVKTVKAAKIAATAAPAVTDAARAWTPARLGVRQLWPPMDGEFAHPPAAADAEMRALVSVQAPSRRAESRQRPVQDEWGFFDPDQCGFAALLAKLDEIIEVDEGSAGAKSSHSRPRR